MTSLRVYGGSGFRGWKKILAIPGDLARTEKRAGVRYVIKGGI